MQNNLDVKANADDFINLIEELRTKQNELSISELIKETLNKSGYTKALELENSVEAESRIQNLEEFLTVAIEFEEEFADNTLGEFLENITLSSDIDNVEDAENSVTLMTLHSAKGLEFPTVFLVGLEEGIFPGYKSIGEENALQEERRLFYVGITRAKEHLFLTCAKRRTIFGSTSYNAISRFVKEIPEAEKEFPSVMLEDQDLKDELKNKKQIDLEVILDFTYLPVMVEGEEEGERPKNPLLFMAYDNTDGGVITMDILEEGDDEISRTLGFFISFVQQNGRMKTIKARNPWIFGALEDICEYCSVDLVYDPVEIMDQVIEEVISQL